MMMSDLSGALDSTPETKASSSPEIDASIAEVPDEDESESQAPAVEGETPPVAEVANPDADEDDPTKPAIENLRDSKWKKVHGGYKYAKEIGKAFGVVGEDGKLDLTLLPAVDEIKSMQVAHSDRMAMEHDFASGNPDNVKQWIENWNTFSPQGMAAMAAHLPEFLATSNQAAYVAAAQPMFNRFFQSALRAVPNLPAELQDRMIDGIRMAEWYANGGMNGGKFTTDEQLTQILKPQAAATNPEQQELQRTKGELQQIRQQQVQERRKSFDTAYSTKAGTELSAEVDKTLQPLREFYPNEPVYNSMRKEFYDAIDKAIASNPNKRLLDMTYENMQSGRATADVEALKVQYMQLARSAINAVRGKFITERSAGLVNASKARDQQLQKAAAKVGTTAPGAPRPQSITGPAQRKPGESASAFTLRQMQSDAA